MFLKGGNTMLNAIKRVIIVFLGVVLQFGFAIIIRLFFYKYIGLITLFYSIVSILIVLAILKNSTRFAMDDINFAIPYIWNNLVICFR